MKRSVLGLPVAAALTLCLLPTAAGSGTLAEDETVEHDGLTRHFDVYVPDGLPNSPVPLLFALHVGLSDNDFARSSVDGTSLRTARKEAQWPSTR